MSQLVAAYGLFYLENRPTLLRAADVSSPADASVLGAARAAGFNAIRPLREGLVDARDAEAHGLALVEHGPEHAAWAPIAERPFAVSVAAQRASSLAGGTAPAAVWGLPAEPASLVCAVARGARAYSVNAPPETWPRLAPVHSWLAEHEEELTASVPVLDGLVCIDASTDRALLEGGFGVLALAGYNPPIVDLRAAEDADLAEYPAALFPCDGALDLPDYGKLVVLTLRGATLVTYPRPVQRTPDGIAYRTTFLWPAPSAPGKPGVGRGGERMIGRRVQVRDGVSTLLTEPFGEPYAGPPYFRLPAGQRVAHRDLALALFGEAAPRALEPQRDVELELVTRLSPDGGALLFVINRLGAQSGNVSLPDLGALHIPPDFSVTTLFSGAGSSGARRDGGLALALAPADALVLRLG